MKGLVVLHIICIVFTADLYSRPTLRIEGYVVKCIGFKNHRPEYYYLPDRNKLLLNDIFLQRDIQELKACTLLSTDRKNKIDPETFRTPMDIPLPARKNSKKPSANPASRQNFCFFF